MKVTDAGTKRGAPLEVKFTTKLLPGVPLAWMVTGTLVPPLTVVGLAVSLVMSGRVRVRFRVMATPFREAVTVRVMETVLAVVPMMKVVRC